MGQAKRYLVERALIGDVVAGKNEPAKGGRAVRTVTVNLAESPLGWLFGHGHLTERQFAAGERLRADWERSRLDPRVTMSWDGAPVARGGGASAPVELASAQIDARRRFERAVAAAGHGLSDILWRIVCAGEGMRDAERALGWPARAGKLVLVFALDRVADYYRLPGASLDDRPSRA